MSWAVPFVTILVGTLITLVGGVADSFVGPSVRISRVLFVGICIFVGGLFLLAAKLLVPAAYAHEAPTGWTYPRECCSDRDCRMVALGDVHEGPDGYLIRQSGELIPYSDARVKPSPDGEFHWCPVAYDAEIYTICLFAPPRGY